jgi:ribonuclease-3 family protein
MNSTSADLQRLSPSALAYLGDAVYELHVRQTLLLPPRRSRDYHRDVVARVRASAQAQALQQLLPELSTGEAAIVQRGRNSCGRIPRHLDPQQYQLASGFEALLGYLYLSDPERLQTLLTRCDGLSGLM